MWPIESSLSRLQLSVGGFVAPSAAVRDVHALKAQIELRRRALRDIEVIRCRLKPFLPCKRKMARRKLRQRRVSRSRLVNSYHAGNARWPV
jgi:hypothetical protein